MRFGVVAVRVVAVVGRQEAELELPGDAQEPRVHPLLLGESVVLELDEERVAAEDVTEAAGKVARRR